MGAHNLHICRGKSNTIVVQHYEVKWMRVFNYLKMLYEGGVYFQGDDKFHPGMTFGEFVYSFYAQKKMVEHLSDCLEKYFWET